MPLKSIYIHWRLFYFSRCCKLSGNHFSFQLGDSGCLLTSYSFQAYWKSCLKIPNNADDFEYNLQFLHAKLVTAVNVVVDWCQQTNSLGVVHVFYWYLNPGRSDKHTTKYLHIETKGIFLVKTPMIEVKTKNSEKVENRFWTRGQCMWLLMPHAVPGTGPLLPWMFSSSLTWPGLCRAQSLGLAGDGIHLIILIIVVSVLSCRTLVNREKSALLGD